ncbi:MAG: non-hydrolyzing UDP-N-acetylglucosamine 2-epimerase [Promethearchaeota archaeon]|jgi:UDP-N-acetylglucosamine 2-epimerase (non-hydrolysing)
MSDKIPSNIFIIGGARPNFMKIAPLIREFKKQEINFKFIHTGQHYDYNMSKIFLDNLGIPKPDYFLNVGSGTHASQTAKIMIEFEKVLLKKRPKLVIVVGDVNSTIACALVAKKISIEVAHIEAGLRSFDFQMPEEINRRLTDQLSDYLFVTERSGLLNLKNEGIDTSKIFFVGNVMIDNLINNLEEAQKIAYFKNLGLSTGSYGLITIHRPSNVDKKKDLENVIKIINEIGTKTKVVFPIHPRTQKNLKKFNLEEKLNNPNIIITKPLGYLEFLNLIMNSKFILTDSGGIQEEASYLDIPILTLRSNTERPVTIEEGTNTLIGIDILKLRQHLDNILLDSYKKGKPIELWDGKASQRITKIILDNVLKK